MSHRIAKLALSLAIAVPFASLGFAKSGVNKPGDNKEVVEIVRISHPTIVNGTSVQPSEYRMVAKGSELKVEDLNHKVVAKTPITWKQSDRRFKTTKMDIDKGVLTKVSLGNTNEEVLLHHSPTVASAK